jgi:hypothetical protein
MKLKILAEDLKVEVKQEKIELEEYKKKKIIKYKKNIRRR